jgi:hypothetical protein
VKSYRPSNGNAQSVSDLNQKVISCRMTQAVIEDLRIIEINEQHSELIARVLWDSVKNVSHAI